jgi:hypothetical protein
MSRVATFFTSSLRAFAAALRKKLRNGDGTFARDEEDLTVPAMLHLASAR